VTASGSVSAYLGRGADSARVVTGSPHVLGGAGTDFVALVGSASHAVVDAGAGYNQISFLQVGRSVTADIAAGRASWSGGGLTFSGVRNLIGSRRSDVLVGSSGTDYLFGSRGADILRGRGGNDALRGDSGNDLADGGSGPDFCSAEREKRCES
jgi:Ca2+-binding RTX toxin-like protein